VIFMNKRKFSGLLAGMTAAFSLAGAPMNAENVSADLTPDQNVSTSSALNETVEDDITSMNDTGSQQEASDVASTADESINSVGAQSEEKTNYWAKSKDMAKKAGNWFGGVVNSASKKAVKVSGGDWDSYSEESKAAVNAGVGVLGTAAIFGIIAIMRSLLSGEGGK